GCSCSKTNVQGPPESNTSTAALRTSFRPHRSCSYSYSGRRPVLVLGRAGEYRCAEYGYELEVAHGDGGTSGDAESTCTICTSNWPIAVRTGTRESYSLPLARLLVTRV